MAAILCFMLAAATPATCATAADTAINLGAHCKWQQRLCQCQLLLFVGVVAATKHTNLAPTSWQQHRHCKTTKTKSEVLVLTLTRIINRPRCTWSLQCVPCCKFLCFIVLLFTESHKHCVYSHANWCYCSTSLKQQSVLLLKKVACWQTWQSGRQCSLSHCSILYGVPTGIIWNHFVVHTIRHTRSNVTKCKTTYTMALLMGIQCPSSHRRSEQPKQFDGPSRNMHQHNNTVDTHYLFWILIQKIHNII